MTRVLRTVAVLIVAGVMLRAQPRLPDEAAGRDAVVRTLLSVFDQADVLALGEVHGRQADSDLRIALVRRPDFATKVRSIVVEFGSTIA